MTVGDDEIESGNVSQPSKEGWVKFEDSLSSEHGDDEAQESQEVTKEPLQIAVTAEELAMPQGRFIETKLSSFRRGH
jgi:hypothetical protein